MISFLSFFHAAQLPWSTANEDLVELFETTGQVETAEILFDGTRSKGCGVVQFSQVAEAETAIGNVEVSDCIVCHIVNTLPHNSQIPTVHVRGTSTRSASVQPFYRRSLMSS